MVIEKSLNALEAVKSWQAAFQYETEMVPTSNYKIAHISTMNRDKSMILG
jgi:hypothetical protein